MTSYAIRDVLAEGWSTRTLTEFRSWFALSSFDLLEDADTPGMELIYEIRLLLAELAHGHRSEDEVGVQLSRRLPYTYWITVGGQYGSGSSGSVTERPLVGACR